MRGAEGELPPAGPPRGPGVPGHQTTPRSLREDNKGAGAGCLPALFQWDGECEDDRAWRPSKIIPVRPYLGVVGTPRKAALVVTVTLS
eukprot:1688249-Pyramimonas_sp.AAC.2